MALPGNNVCAVHVYGHRSLRKGLPALADYCTELGKPWLMEETGVPQRIGDTARARWLSRVIAASWDLGAAGVGVWNIGGETTEQILEYVPPDRFHMRSAGGESIMIGGDWYLRVGDRWPRMMALFNGADSPMGFSTDAVFNAEAAGEETLRGERVRRYTYQAPSTTAAAGELDQTTLWVRLEDALPVQIEAANANSVTRSSIEYDAAIQIEAPDIAP